MSHPDPLTVTIADGIARVTFDRPEVMNAFDAAQRQRFKAALLALESDVAVRVIVLTGRGRAFCAGQDQNESAAMDAAGSAARIDDYMDLYDVFRGLTKPVIASLNGVAAGAGLQIALMSDLRIGCEHARLGMTELNVGSAAIVGSALLLPIIGEAAMKRLVLLAEILSADQALSMGLLHEVVPQAELDTRVTVVAQKLAQWSPISVAITKSWWKTMSDEAFEKSAQAARHGHALNFASGAYTEGAQRFKARKSGS
ncbi:enoyl-CoA hydratase/isomerase family protein [Alcaligenaceae bacterium C4P045]|nr:enoyl-CoA hydratase/isomerase family protein [Alcaligenaceae bacterium C4P045]